MDELSDIKIKISAIAALENKLASYNFRLKEAEENTRKLLEKYEKEKLDVQKMQKDSLYFYLLKFFGKFNSRLEKEEREEIEAKLNYDRAIAELKELEREKSELEEKLLELRRLEIRYQAELERRRQVVLHVAGEKGDRYRQLEGEIESIAGQLTEIDQAQNAAYRARRSVESAIEALENAESWATYDVWGSGGLISHMAKYSHIDSAESSLSTLNSQLKILRNELQDIQGIEMPGLNSFPALERAMDYWFDNIFTDLSVRRKIIDNINTLRNLMGSINNIITALEQKKQHLISRLGRCRELQEELLISLN